MNHTPASSLLLDIEMTLDGKVTSVIVNPHQRQEPLSHKRWQALQKRINNYFDSCSPEDIEKIARATEERHRCEWTEAITSLSIKKEIPGFVYVLAAGDLYKIGRAKDPQKRFAQLQNQDPYPTDIIHTIATETSRIDEHRLHCKFAAKRKNGEWFELSQEDVEWLKTL